MLTLPSLLLLLAPLTAFSHPNPPPSSYPPFTVSTLNIFEPSGRSGQINLYHVEFTVTDPSDANAQATCEVNWEYAQANTGWPHNYLGNCSDSSFAFKFSEWVNYMDFTLDVRHKTKKHGQKKVTKFAKGPVNLNTIQCAHAASGFSVCSLKTGTVLSLPVYDVKD
jgi:hypothetical protein